METKGKKLFMAAPSKKNSHCIPIRKNTVIAVTDTNALALS
jgi:hypothetical protein